MGFSASAFAQVVLSRALCLYTEVTTGTLCFSPVYRCLATSRSLIEGCLNAKDRMEFLEELIVLNRLFMVKSLIEPDTEDFIQSV